MQDIHSIGGGGRLFSGGGGDRRLRPHNHQNNQVLKCPRCESLNTKFCYYNNYNLSQPRYFCKGCRRYWTKGGILRNVPVGGGCRKTKRSKLKQTASTPDNTTSTTSPPPPPPPQQLRPQRERDSSNSRSSSESSSLTATNTAASNTGLEAVSGLSAHSSSSASNSILNRIGDSKIFSHVKINQSFEPGLLEQGSDCGIFSEIGSLTSLITSRNEPLGFGFSHTLSQQSLEHVQQNLDLQWQQLKIVGIGEEEMKMQEVTEGLIDRTVEFSALQSSRSGNREFGPLDWEGTGDQGLFDLPNIVDHTYWSQSQWTDPQDHPGLYLP